MARTLLFLSADTFRAYLWKGSMLSEAGTFTNDADGRTRFAAFLEQNRQPAYLLTDIIEEDFHLEAVPHLIGPSRRDLLERKFEQYYRSTPFRQATLVQRLSEGRRDDEFLFSALTNPQRIWPWVETLLANHIPLVGLYSIPIISTPLLQRVTSEHVLLLTWEKSAGLRQTYFNNRRLHFSRLIPITNDTSFAQAVVGETPRTQQYLRSLSLPPAGEVLDVHIICHGTDRAELQTRLSNDVDLRYTYLDIVEFAKQRKCRHEFVDSDATPLFLHQLATRAPTAHYASPVHTHFYLLWQLRRLFIGLAAATTLAALVWSAFSFWRGREFAGETEQLQARIEQLRRQTQQVQAGFAGTSVPATDMKTAVLLARSLNEYSPPPKEVLENLSLVLEEYPRVKVAKLAWQSSAADAAPSPYPAQVITFDGELTEFGREHRQALTYLERFQKALVQRGYVVTAQTLPLDVSSKGSISGDIGVAGKPAQFTLKIIWRHPS